MDGKLVTNNYGIRDALSEKLPGDNLSLKIFKKESGKTEVVELQLAESQ